MTAPAQQTLHDLALRLQRLRAPGSPRQSPPAVHSTGLAALDELLPDRGLAPGSFVECLADDPGAGAGALAFNLLAEVLRSRPQGHAVVVDSPGVFYPPAIEPATLARMIVVRPAEPRSAVWAWEQTLRCPEVAVVIGWLDRWPPQAYRRLKLAAETGGAIGLVLRYGVAAAQPSWADVRLRIQPLPLNASRPPPGAQGRRLRIELLYCRGRCSEAALELELDDETGALRLASELACATVSRRAAGA